MKLNFSILIILICFSCNSTKTKQNVASPSIQSTESSSIAESDPSHFPYEVVIKDLNHRQLKSSDVLKKNGLPTVIMFWLTTCNPCGKELRSITANYDQWQKANPFHLVAMSYDREENFNAILERTRAEKWPFETYWDFNRNFGALMPGNLNGLPQTFIFNKNGELTYSKRGYLPGDETIIFEKIKEASKS